jgi:dTDP-4-dehydrorhamnose reductase
MKHTKVKMKKVLVLGVTGMLGSMIYDYLRRNDELNVAGTFRDNKSDLIINDNNKLYQFKANNNIEKQLLNIYKRFGYDYIINAIGIIKPYCKDNDMQGVYNAIIVNSLFPHKMANVVKTINKKIRIIQIATDCVYSGKDGMYDENAKHDPLDVYGKTKSLGEVNSENLLNIRCSIIGPEIKGKMSLLEWFLSNPDGSTINGYSHHKWNGVTTMQFAQLCENIIIQNSFNKLLEQNFILHYIINKTVAKYDLLCLIR